MSRTSKEHPRTTMHRRVAAKVSRMTLTECEDWWDRWVAAWGVQDLHTLGEMTSALTGADEPSRSQNIKSYVKRKVYDRMKKLRNG